MEIDKIALETVMQTGGELVSPIFSGNPMFQTNAHHGVFQTQEETKLDYVFLANCLKRAVLESLSCYEKIAVMVSGGIDSTLLLKLITDVTDAEVVAYHLNWYYKPRDESYWAKMAARHCGVEYREVNVSASAQVPHLRKAMKSTLSPDYTITAVCMAMEKMKRDGFNHVANALGLDEYFAGYPIHRKVYARQRQRYPHILPHISSHRRGIKGIMRYFGNGKAFFVNNLFPNHGRNFVHGVNAKHLMERLYKSAKQNNLWNTVQCWNLMHMVDNYASLITRAGDTAGIRVAFPYINKSLLRYSMRLNPEVKTNKIPIRYLMKHVFLLPDILVKRGGDWSDLKTWDKYALGGTVLPYFECDAYMQQIAPDYSLAEEWFTQGTIDRYLKTMYDVPNRIGFQMSLFLKILKWMKDRQTKETEIEG